MTIYKAQKKYVFSNSLFLVFPLLLTVVTFFEGSAASQNEWLALFGFWMIGIILVIVPLVLKLEVANNYVRSYFGNFCVKEFKPSEILSVDYMNLFKGGLGYGKGLIIYVKMNGKRKRYSMGEKLYGKEAIEHVRRVLEQK